MLLISFNWPITSANIGYYKYEYNNKTSKETDFQNILQFI